MSDTVFGLHDSKVYVVFQCSQHAIHAGQNWVFKTIRQVFFQLSTVFNMPICVYVCLQVIMFSIGDLPKKKIVNLKTGPTRAKFLPRSRRDWRHLAEIGEISSRLQRSRRDCRDLAEISP